jgi:hypothetical protein
MRYPVGRYLRAIAGTAGHAQNARQVVDVSDPQSRRKPTMARLRERCPECGRRLVNSRFDTTFRMPDRSERLAFSIPGGLCEDCHQLYIDPELIDLLDLGRGRCVFAIESDLVLQEQAWSSTD